MMAGMAQVSMVIITEVIGGKEMVQTRPKRNRCSTNYTMEQVKYPSWPSAQGSFNLAK